MKEDDKIDEKGWDKMKLNEEMIETYCLVHDMIQYDDGTFNQLTST